MKTPDSLQKYVSQGGFYEAVIEEGADMIIIVDFKGIILYHNPSVKETLGYKPKELIGKNFFDYIHPDLSTSLKEEFKEIIKRNFAYNIEFRFKCYDGSYKYLEFNSINLHHKEELNGLILDCRDISQRKKVAIELVKAILSMALNPRYVLPRIIGFTGGLPPAGTLGPGGPGASGITGGLANLGRETPSRIAS